MLEKMTPWRTDDDRIDYYVEQALGVSPATLKTSRVDYGRALFHKKLPVVITGSDFTRLDIDFWQLTLTFRFPCPCKDWRLDRPHRLVVRLVDRWVMDMGQHWHFRHAKKQLRAEAAEHVIEYLKTGTMV